MSQSVSVLLLDDGELDDIQSLLESMRVPFGRVRGASIVAGMQGPSNLLISTPRRIEAVTSVRTDPATGSEPIRIMVASEESNALRARLRSIGFDYLVRRPVHPEALRLLILHALYAGEERRGEPRVAVGFDVTYKSGLIARQATLADLSMRGCRLLSSRSLDAGKRIRIVIPEALGATEPLSLRGHVIRAVFDERTGKSGRYTIAVLFDGLSGDDRRELEWILEERSKGPPRLDEGRERSEGREHGEERGPISDRREIREIPARNLRADPRFEAEELRLPAVDIRVDPIPEDDKPLEETAAVTTSPIEPEVARVVARATDSTDSTVEFPKALRPANASDRRRSRRAAFASKVPAFGSRALRVLIGRDISAGGMRVEPNLDIAVGDRLHLAIYADPGEEPLLAWATVERDDDERGLGIAFDELDDDVAAKLERLVVSLPAVESLNDSEADAMGTVLTEILPPEGG